MIEALSNQPLHASALRNAPLGWAHPSIRQKQHRRFHQMFKDLAAEEVKTIEVDDKPNVVSGRKRIVSDFFI